MTADEFKERVGRKEHKRLNTLGAFVYEIKLWLDPGAVNVWKRQLLFLYEIFSVTKTLLVSVSVCKLAFCPEHVCSC